MTLELSDNDALVLTEALERHLGDLRDELVHTDERDYRAALRSTLDHLEQIRARLERAQGEDRRPDTGPRHMF